MDKQPIILWKLTAYAMITEYDTAQYVKLIRNIAGGNMKDKIIKNTYGFTLIEMIVVMIIIGILAAIMVPSLLHYIDRSKADECEVNRKALVLLLEGARAQEPGKTMYDIVDENEASGEITCPSGGQYEAVNNNTVRCNIPEHGENGVFTDESVHAMGDVEVIIPEMPSTDSVEESEETEADDTKETGREGELCFKVGDVWFTSMVADYFARENVGYWVPFPPNSVVTVDGSKFYLQYEYSGGIEYGYNGYNVHINGMQQINTDNILILEEFLDKKFTQTINPGQIIIDKNGKYFVALITIMQDDSNAKDVTKQTYWRPINLCSS